jgi:hypothetical protein
MMTDREKERLEQSVKETFGENRISYGAYIAYLCERHEENQ